MTCGHCRSRVEEALRAVRGVYSVFVDLAGGSADVDFDDGKTNPAALVEAIRAVGYEAEAPQ